MFQWTDAERIGIFRCSHLLFIPLRENWYDALRLITVAHLILILNNCYILLCLLAKHLFLYNSHEFLASWQVFTVDNVWFHFKSPQALNIYLLFWESRFFGLCFRHFFLFSGNAPCNFRLTFGDRWIYYFRCVLIIFLRIGELMSIWYYSDWDFRLWFVHFSSAKTYLQVRPVSPRSGWTFLSLSSRWNLAPPTAVRPRWKLRFVILLNVW